MIRKDTKVFQDGSVKTYIRVVESYRPGSGKQAHQRTLKSFGYLEDQPDPEAFMREVEAFDADPSNREQVSSNKMYSGQNRRLNYGYKFLEAVYTALDIDGFIERYQISSGFRGKYSLKDIAKLLIWLRILAPDSKRASTQQQNGFYGWEPQIELPEVYRTLDHMDTFSLALQKHLDVRIKALIGRDLQYAFYDVTNYFFEIDFPDEAGDRQNGISKEHRTDPIIQMGLLIDPNGLPVSMSLFPGNTSDTLTLQPVMIDLKKSYQLQRLIVVADKGLNSTRNIDYICNNGDGYVVSQVLRGTKGNRYHPALFEEEGYVWNHDKTYKYKLFTEEYAGKDKDEHKVVRQRQVLIYWSKTEADRARRKREDKLKKAERACKNNAYGIKKGSQEYVREEIVDLETGELQEVSKKAIRSVNLAKAEHDALFDGYFCLITSEMDFNAQKIREVYGGLWKIEQSFRVMKSDLLARPVYVNTPEHIRAHFLICFVALLIVRVIQHAMERDVISVERLVASLNAANCKVRRGGLVELDDVGGSMAFVKRKNKQGKMVDTLEFSDEDEIANDYKKIQKVYGTDLYDVEVKQEAFGRFLKKITLRL